MTPRHAGVRTAILSHLRFSALLRQPPEAIAFLEAILGGGKTGTIQLHVKDGKALSWAFTRGRGAKDVDARTEGAVG